MQLWEVKNSYEETKDKAQILGKFKEYFAEFGVDEAGTPLVMLAAKHAHPEALEWLASQDISLNVTGDYEFTPLHEVAKMGWRYYKPEPDDIRKCTRLLLGANVSVLRKDENEYMTCYHYAARSGNYQFVEELKGKKLDMTDKNGNTGIHIACDYVRHEIEGLEYRKRDVDNAWKRKEEAIAMHKDWDMDTLNQYIKNNWANTPEQTEQIYEDTVKLIDDYYKTVCAFIHGGVDPDEKNNYEESALDVAVKSNAKKIAAFLSGEDVDSGEVSAAGGMTIHQAAEKGDTQAIKALHNRGDDLNAVNDREGRYLGYTPLAIACALLNLETVAALIDNGADPNAKDNDAHTPAYFISREVYTKTHDSRVKNILTAMKKAGMEVNGFVDDDSNTLLNKNCTSPDIFGVDVINELLNMGADVNIANRFGETPLMRICRYDSTYMENIQLIMLENGADVTAKDINGNTPLHYAAGNRSAGLAKTFSDMLFEFGKADANAANNEGKTPLDIATENNNEPLVKYLLGKM